MIKDPNSTPAHFTTPNMISLLCPTLLDRAAARKDSPHEINNQNDDILITTSDVVEINFNNTGLKNHMLYATANTKSQHLQNAYSLYRKHEENTESLLRNMPKEGLGVNDKAGGCYICGGIAAFHPVPSGCKKQGLKVRPYLLQSTVVSETGDVLPLYSKVLGEIAAAIAEFLPEIYAKNHTIAIPDCAYPTPEMQCSSGDNKKWWYSNQAIVRIFEKGYYSKKMEESKMRIALHCDNADLPEPQMLRISSCEHRVPDSNILVFFVHSAEGPCYRINTTIPDTYIHNCCDKQRRTTP